MDIVIFFNNTKKQLNFPGLPGAAGTAPSRAAKNHQDQIRGERPGPGGILASVAVMAARKEQGGQQAQEQGREFQHGEGSSIFYFLLQRAAPQFFPSGTQGASCGIWAESGVTFPTLSRSRASSLRRASFSLRRRESSAAKGRSRSTGIGDHA